MPALANTRTRIDRLASRAQEFRNPETREGGFATMEMLAITGLSLIALLVIFVAIQALGVDLVAWMRTKIIGP